MTNSQYELPKATEPADRIPSPRAFVHATGYIYQSFGFVLTMVMCCWWPANCWQDPVHPAVSTATSAAAYDPPNPLRDAAPEALWAMASVALAFIGGLCLLVVGFGLQQDRLRSGRSAMVLTGLLAAFYWSYLGFAIVQFPSTGRIIVSALFAAAWTVCFLLAGASSEQLRAHPPTRSEQSWTSRDEDAFRKSLSPGSRDKKSP